jgi:hypothetical protein
MQHCNTQTTIFMRSALSKVNIFLFFRRRRLYQEENVSFSPPTQQQQQEREILCEHTASKVDKHIP